MGKHSPPRQEEQKGGQGSTPLVATRKCKEGLCEVDCQSDNVSRYKPWYGKAG